jgi:hypothetical protein
MDCFLAGTNSKRIWGERLVSSGMSVVDGQPRRAVTRFPRKKTSPAGAAGKAMAKVSGFTWV